MEVIESIPLYVNIVFILTTFLTIYFFHKATTQNSKMVLLIIFIWITLQGVLSFNGFYQITDTIPPRFILMAVPPMLFILFLLISRKGKNFIDSLDTKTLTLLHIIRVPVEIVLWLLFVHKAIPGIMTFEGRNFDILAGLSAPFIYYFGYLRKSLSHSILIIWNILCVGLLVNIVVHAILSAPSNFQQFAFNQPNIAILHFPLVWLPSCVVPLVFLSHFASIRNLLAKKDSENINSSKTGILEG